MMVAASTMLGAQVLTFAIPIGTLVAVCFWAFFQRHPSR